MVENGFGKIGVLMGGPSSEREISLRSGSAVYNTLKEAGFDVLPLDILNDDLESNMQLIKNSRIDVAFIALHGRFGEDGTIQGLLENLNIPYTGSGVMASRLAMDKVASRKIFKVNGLCVPEYNVIARDVKYKIDNKLFPLVVKPATHGSSIGLSIVDNEKDFTKAIETAFKLDERVIVEEYISGREFTVGILDEGALSVIEIRPKNRFFDFEAKYKEGMTDYIVPADISKLLATKLKESALLAHKLLGCFGCSRVDMILGYDNNPYVLEVNTIPGLTSTSLLPKAAGSMGISFLKLCLELIRLAYERQEDKALH